MTQGGLDNVFPETYLVVIVTFTLGKYHHRFHMAFMKIHDKTMQWLNIELFQCRENQMD